MYCWGRMCRGEMLGDLGEEVASDPDLRVGCFETVGNGHFWLKIQC